MHSIKLNRRLFLSSSAAAVAVGAAPGFAQPSDYYSIEFLEELFESNSEDIVPIGADRLSGESYREIVEMLNSGAFRVAWPTWEDAPDYAHLEASASEQPFAFDAAALRRLIADNGFEHALNVRSKRVLFGLRGCRVASEAGRASGTSVELVEATPDHRTHRCVLGVLNLENDEVSVFAGSTVPDAAYAYAQFAGQEGANMMPTGCYRYTVGTHVWRRRTSRQPGAWRQTMAWPVRRAKVLGGDGALAYSHAAEWDVPAVCGSRALTGNNIHAGVLDNWEGGVRFSSAGCQVVSGRYQPAGDVPAGLWSDFRVAAGLPRTPELMPTTGPDNVTPTVRTPEDGSVYYYVLLTGAEARLAASGQTPGRRLRYGSRNEAVGRVQAALAREVDRCIRVDGDLGMQGISASVRYQQANGLRADGIVTPELAVRLGTTL